MIKVMISGFNGAMGQNVKNIVEGYEDMKIVCGFDKQSKGNEGYPIYSSFDDIKEEIDVVIDFSHFSLVDDLIDFCVGTNTALVCATTGLEDTTNAHLEEASNSIPIFKTGNFSYGISVVSKMLELGAKMLCEDFDTEIIEKHHNRKVDAPSGTAYMLADVIKENADKNLEYKFSRYGKDVKREKSDLTIHAVRGGTIVGEHEVIFAGEDEIIEVKHTALSRKVFAVGAVKAGRYIYDKGRGYFEMNDIV